MWRVPDIMGAFGVGQDQAQWMATAFFAAMTAAMLISDWLTRSFGMRTVFVFMMIAFVAGSIAGGTAQSYSLVVLGRAVQGFAAGAILPLTMMAMFSVFPPERRAMVAGLFGISFHHGSRVWVRGSAAWRSMPSTGASPSMWHCPSAFISVMLALVVFPGRDRDAPLARLDWLGFLLVAVFLTATLTGLSNGQLKGWDSNFVVAMLCLGFGCSHRASSFGNFGSPTRSSTSAFCAIPNLPLPVWLRFWSASRCSAPSICSRSSSRSSRTTRRCAPGLYLSPGGIAMGIALPLAGRLADRYPPSIILASGFLIFAVSTWLMGLTDANTSFWSFRHPRTARAYRSGIPVPACHPQPGWPQHPPRRWVPPTVCSTSHGRWGGAFGINLLAINLERRTAYFSELLAATQTEANTTTQELLATVRGMLDTAGLPEITETLVATLYLGRVIAAQATALAFRDTFFVFAIVSFIAVGCCTRPVVTAAEIIRPIRSSGPVLKTTRHIPRRRVPRFRSSGPQRPPVCSPPESDRCRRSVPESPGNGVSSRPQKSVSARFLRPRREIASASRAISSMV